MSAAQSSQHFDPASLAPREGSTSARNCGRNAEPLSKLHLVSRLSELDQDLSQRYINDSARAEALKPQIESAARRLSQAPFAGADEYVEGRRGLFGRKLGSDTSPELGSDGDSSGLIPHSVRTRIDYYLQASAQNARQMPMHVMAILVGLLIFAGALFVDYTIVSEFWTRALANEFLELPGSLADSVGFKSLQVLFAAIAAHFVFASLGPVGQKTFTRIVFVFALLMLAGLGFLLATMSLPAGSADTFGGTTSLDEALAGLGLGGEGATVPAAPAAPGIAEEALSRDVHAVTWLASLGVIFLVVTGVAAIALHSAVRGFTHLVAVGEYRQRAAQAADLTHREHEYVQLAREIEQLQQPQARRAILWAGLMREVQAHLDGMNEAKAGLSRPSRAASGRRGFFGMGNGAAMQPIGDAAEADDRDSLRARLERNEQSMSVEAYEEIFDNWWASRSQAALAQGADAALPSLSPRPAQQALPPLSA